MLLTIEGLYTEGKVELCELPAGIKQAKVLVTFLTTEEKSEFPRAMRYGQFAGDSPSTEEDFRLAEWQGEAHE